MPLVLYNSLTRRKEQFVPINPLDVRMYVCGPTVYDFAHIGNARAVVAFDLLYRVLRHEYGESHVRYVRNITDIDDKIIAAAREYDEPIEALTERTIADFHYDMEALGNLPPDIEPRATEYIPQMILMIERLIASGHAYAAQGHALFRVASYAKYGALARRSRADMIAGARVEIAPYKEDPGDFVLWKPSTPDQPGWDSPWGRGRPGWHIECSAMSEETLGETFDIHGGGLDLIFPHHENEIAQSVCAHDGHPFARYWLHNGMLTVGGAKMAKSEGNFVTVRDALAQGTDRTKQGQIIRLALLSTHYRDPLDWTEARLHQARQTLDRWYRALMGFSGDQNSLPSPVTNPLEDDLNTPLAITQLHELANAIYHIDNPAERTRLQGGLVAGGRLMGLLAEEPRRWLQGHGSVTIIVPAAQPTLTGHAPDVGIASAAGSASGKGTALGVGTSALSEDFDKRIKERIDVRAQARKERRFDDADRIRDELAAEGIILEDHPDRPTTWRSE